MAVESRILKCKLGPLLQQDFKPFKNEFRVISEEHSILRRDAINFACYMVVHWLENRDTGDPQPCPPLLQGQFWSHCYRLVSDYRNFRLDVDVAVNMAHRFIEFDNLRLNEAREYLYPRVQLDLLHATLANSYGVDIMTNIKLHLTRNIPVYQKRILKGFFMRYKIDNGLENFNPGQLADEAFRNLFRLRVNQIDGLYGDQGEVHAVALRNFFRAQFNRWRTTFANTKLEVITDFSYATPARVATILQFYAALLNDIGLHNLNVKRWSLIPIATHQMVHVNFSGPVIVYILLQRLRNRGPLPDIELQHETGILRFNQGTTRAEFLRHYRIPEFKEHLWQQIFRLDKLVKNRRLENEVNRDRPYQLAYGFKTDGHMISMHFYKDMQGRPPIPFDMGELRTMARNLDVSHWENGMVELIKEPIGLPNDCRIVGVDPGVRDLLCAVERVNVEGQEVNRKAFSISNAEYQVRSGRQWAQMKELQSREHAHIQEVYDLIASPKVHTITDFSLYVRSISQTHNRIFDFNRSYRHREIKGYLYSARRMTLDYIADNIIGLYPLRVDNETYCKVMLPHKSTKKERRRARKRFRNEITGFRPPTQRTIVAFGDASINSSMKGHPPIPHQQQQRAIARKAILVRVDEYNTSQTCNVCSSHLENVYSRENVCFEHRKRRKKIQGVQKRKKCCVGDDLSIISQASQCTQRTLHNVLLYPLKFCNQCLAGRSTVWNRDFNAAINIRNILALYIENNYDINSRPTPLSRTRR